MRRVCESLLPSIINKYYIYFFVLVHAWKRAYACVSAHACKRFFGRVDMCMSAHVALLIQHAARMHHIVSSFVASLTPSYLSTLSHIRQDNQNKVFEHEICFDFLYNFFFWNISHSKKNLVRYCRKCENVFVWSIRYYFRILMKLEFSRHIFE